MAAVPVNHCSLHRHATHVLLLHSHTHVLLSHSYVLLRVSLAHAHVRLSHAHVWLSYAHVRLPHAHVLLSHAHVLLSHAHVWLFYAHVRLSHHLLLLHSHARVTHATHVLLLHRLCIVRHSSDCHCFRMISGFNDKSTCGHTSPEKLYRLIKMAIWTFKEVEVNLSVSNRFCAKNIFVSDFDVKLVLHATAFNLHVFVQSPSWVSPAINTDSGSPFLKISDTHKNERVHFVHHSSSIVSQVALNGVDSQMTATPVNHCSLHGHATLVLLLDWLLLYSHATHILLHHWLLLHSDALVAHSHSRGNNLNNNGCTLVDEFRSHVDLSSWPSVVENFNPFLASARNCKSLKRNLNSSDNAFFVINALDVDLLADVSNFDIHELTCWPSWFFATIVAYSRFPILELAHMNVYEGVHAVKRAAYLVSENGVVNVKSDVSSLRDH